MYTQLQKRRRLRVAALGTVALLGYFGYLFVTLSLTRARALRSTDSPHNALYGSKQVPYDPMLLFFPLNERTPIKSISCVPVVCELNKKDRCSSVKTTNRESPVRMMPGAPLDSISSRVLTSDAFLISSRQKPETIPKTCCRLSQLFQKTLKENSEHSNYSSESREYCARVAHSR